MQKHSFVISAWKESPYIEDTVKSLLAQTVPSDVIIATSSPNEFLKNLCTRYNIKYIVNPDAFMADSAVNWSFAYSVAKTKYVTLAHQDDIYLPDYTEKMLAAAEKKKDVVMAFSRCSNYCNGKRVNFHLLLFIKDILLLPYFLKNAIYSKKIRFFAFSLGNPVCCPTVMFNKELIGNFYFDPQVKVNLDWDAWLRLTRLKGAFLFVPHSTLLRRIHEESGTTITYNDGSRGIDDFNFFCKFWPRPIAWLLNKLYSLARYLN